MNTRRYEQRLRAEAAEERRQHILEIMYEQVKEAPAEALSLDRVAQKARVARSTLYLIFGSRAGLFEALFRYLLDRAGFERIAQAVRHPQALEHLRGSLRAGARVYAAERDVTRAFYSMTALNPDSFAGVVRRDEEGRAEGMRYMAQRLSEQGVLRPDISVTEAADILFAITSFDTFDLLYSGRNLSAETVADLLVAMAERSLCS